MSEPCHFAVVRERGPGWDHLRPLDSHITHLIEDGWDGTFVQMQAGHKHGSTTAIYTGVSSDFKNQVLLANIRKQLNPGEV